MSGLVSSDAIADAARRLAPHLPPTPLRRSAWLSELLSAEVFLKLECVQPTGSFKVRGAFSKLVAISAADPNQPLRAVAASTGNHGCAVAYALQRLGGTGTVFVPETAAANKVDRIKRFGAAVRQIGSDGLDAEVAARHFAEQERIAYVSPYNDLTVVAGQGTLGVELEDQLQSQASGSSESKGDWLFASVGGGGLIGGTASWLKRPASSLDQVKVIGSSPKNSQVMIDSIRAGQILEKASLPTLSDGTAGGVEAGAVTFEIVQAAVDGYSSVSELEIERAVAACAAEEGLMIEGAAAVAIASLLQEKERVAGGRATVVLCGANIDVPVLRRLLG